MTRRVALFVCLVWLGIAEVSRAEVAVPFGPPGTGSGRHGLFVSIIGDAPDPFPQLWDRYSLESSGSTPLNPNGSENGDGIPATLVHPATGEPIVAWARNSGGNYDVVITRFHDGAWIEPIVVAGGAENELDPALAVDEDGSIHLVYWIDGMDRAVWHVHGPADLSTWSAPTRVSDPTVAASRPDAVFHEGVLRVVHESHDLGFGSNTRTIVLSRREGAVFVREVVAVTSHEGTAGPRVGSHGGRLWVDWVDAIHPTGGGELAWVRIGAAGPEPPGYLPFDGPFDRELHVRPSIRRLVLAP